MNTSNLCIFTIALLATACQSAQKEKQPTRIDGWEKRTHLNTDNNKPLPYRLLYPGNLEARKSYPLVLFLHGAGERGNDNILQLRNYPSIFETPEARQNFPCFLLLPQCPSDDAWVNFPGFPASIRTTDEPTEAMKNVLALIDSLKEKLNVDQKRIYVIGLSLGGEGTFDILGRRPGLFAAGVPICSVADTSRANSIKRIPLWAFHGEKDEINDVKYTRMMIDKLKKAGGSPQYTEFPGVGHNCWPNVWGEPGLVEWMFAQRRE